MTVYAVQQQLVGDKVTGQYSPRYDITPAKEFGEIAYLLDSFASPFNTKTVLKELREKLQDFGADDHLLLTGNPVLIGLATAVAAEYSDVVTFLQWSGQHQAYIEIKSNFLYNQ